MPKTPGRTHGLASIPKVLRGQKIVDIRGKVKKYGEHNADFRDV